MSNDPTFDNEYQKHFLSFICRDSDFLLSVLDDLEYNLFSDQTAQRVVRIVKDYGTVNKAAPGSLIFHHLDDLKSRGLLSNELHSTISTFVDDLFAVPLQNKSYLLSFFTRFTRHQKVKTSLPSFVEYVKKGDFDRAEAIMEEIFQHKQRQQADLDGVFSLDPSSRINRRLTVEDNRLWTLMPDLDCRVDGLLGGELGVLQSQRSSIGKTAALVQFVRGFLFQGKKVLVYVLEGGRNSWEDRLDLCISGCTRNELTNFTELSMKLQKLTRVGGAVRIFEYPMKITKTSTIIKHADLLEEQVGFKPDVLIVDYADLLAPEDSSLNGDLHASGADVYGNLISFLQRKKIPGWTAMQSNRSAMESVKAGQYHTGGSIAKVQMAQLVLSLNRTEAQTREGLTEIFVVKNRDGRAEFEFTIKTDFEHGQFYKRPDEFSR